MIGGTSQVWLIWQLADSAFPTGGFAHSGGLEAAWQHREVKAGDLKNYLGTALHQLVHSALPFLNAAFHKLLPLATIDAECDAFLTNHVANRASRGQGQAFLASAERIFRLPALSEWRGELRAQGAPGHFVVVFGGVAALLGLASSSAARLFVFMQLRGWISAAVRLNVVGPLEGQTIQLQLTETAEATAHRIGEVPLDDAAQTAPLLDLWQGSQDRLYSRLFQT